MSIRKKYAIGIDLGGTKMLIALLRGERVIARLKFRVKVDEGEKYLFDTLIEGVKGVLKEGRILLKEIEGVGVGCPGLITDKGVVMTSPNIPFLEGIALAGRIHKKLGVKVYVENDVNTGLLGEHRFGAAAGFSNVVGIFMGTGIGGALILDNKLYRGATGAAGEVGHLLMDVMGPLCGCGRRGCLEAMAGRLALASDAVALMARQQAPHLWKDTEGNFSKIKSSALAQAIQEGDHFVETLVRSSARLVGVAMANIVNLLNPNLIVLGGGLVEAMPDLIVEEAKEAMREHVMLSLVKTIEVLPAKLGDDAIIMGAAHLVYNRQGC